MKGSKVKEDMEILNGVGPSYCAGGVEVNLKANIKPFAHLVDY